MPRTCTVCTHADRSAVDQAIVGGEALRGIARTFRVSEDALSRHKSEHLPGHLVTAKQAADLADADSLLDRLRALNRETAGVLKAAKAAKEYELMLKAIARAEKQIELEGRLLGELHESQTVNVLVLPEFVAVRQAILAALAAYPEARLAVADQLAALEGRG